MQSVFAFLKLVLGLVFLSAFTFGQYIALLATGIMLLAFGAAWCFDSSVAYAMALLLLKIYAVGASVALPLFAALNHYEYRIANGFQDWWSPMDDLPFWLLSAILWPGGLIIYDQGYRDKETTLADMVWDMSRHWLRRGRAWFGEWLKIPEGMEPE